MKKLALTLTALFAFAACAFAQKTPTVVVVNMETVLNGYYKTTESRQRLQGAAETSQKELNDQLTSLRDLEGKIQEKNESLNNPALTDEGRKKIQEDAQPLITEYQTKRQAFEASQRRVQSELQSQSNSINATLVKDITEKAIAIAKEKNADMVLTTGITGVLWADSAYDISQLVIDALNAGQPKN
mgnify:CR=1 FL=1